MSGREAPRLPGVLVAAAASAPLFALAWAMASRVGVPFALEWQEPAMLEHALRLRAGEPLYVEPSVDFAPFPYPPLFYAVGGLLMGALGESLSALRAASILGVLMVFGALAASFRLRRASSASALPGWDRGWIPGWIACGWMAAMYGLTGFWLDVARVDSLALGWGALGLAAVLRAESRSEVRPQEGSSGSRSASTLSMAALGGAASSLAVLTKQTQLGLAVALAAGLLLRARTRRLGVVYLAAFLGVLAPAVLWLERSSDGVFLWTTVDLLRGSPFHPPAVIGYWLESGWVLALPLVLGACAFAKNASTGWSPCLGMAALALVLTGWLGRAHEGGFDNTLLPTALASAFATGAALRSLYAESSSGSTSGSGGGAEATRKRAVEWVGAAAVVAAMLLVFRDPRPVIPAAADHLAHAEAAAQVEQLRGAGEVWQPVSALPAESRGFVHKMAIVDLAKSQEVEAAQRFFAELAAALQAQRFSSIILDGPPRQEWGDLGRLIEASYEVTGQLGAPARSSDRSGDRFGLTPRTGAPVTPRLILTPR